MGTWEQCASARTPLPRHSLHFHPASLSRAANSPRRSTDLEAVAVTASVVDEVCLQAHSHCAHRTTSRHRGAQWMHQETETQWTVLPTQHKATHLVHISLHINATSPDSKCPTARAPQGIPLPFSVTRGFKANAQSSTLNPKRGGREQLVTNLSSLRFSSSVKPSTTRQKARITGWSAE